MTVPNPNKSALPILLASSGFFHPPWLGRFYLNRALKGFHLRQISSLEALLRFDLNDFQAIVIYLHHKRISEAAVAVLEDFVSQGGGLLGIHSATASFRESQPYFEILGGRFSGHGPVESFHVQPAPEQGEPFSGLDGFTVRDELYRHDLQPGLRVHFEAFLEGESIPVVWTHHYGKGRVVYASPGHTAATMSHPTYMEILQRGLRWASGSYPE